MPCTVLIILQTGSLMLLLTDWLLFGTTAIFFIHAAVGGVLLFYISIIMMTRSMCDPISQE